MKIQGLGKINLTLKYTMNDMKEIGNEKKN